MADMSNEQWLAALRIELSQAGRWVEITSQTADRLEESDRQLAEYRNTPTSDDSELQGELDAYIDAHKEIREVIGSLGINNAGAVSGVKQLADAMTAERARVAELEDELSSAVADRKLIADEQCVANQRIAELQHRLETERAANARRAEESQLEPVGWACRGAGPDIVFSATWDDATRGLSGHVDSSTRRRVYLGPAEPLEVTP